MLSRLRFDHESGGGRRYPEPNHPYRTAYQRDRDRIIHSRAFRRLGYKTQVFTAPYSDHFRDRLTHTLEVSQVARTVAAALGLNQDLVEALALAHDIGHPPFGHAGEDVLDEQMQRYGERFDHNLHALRIVESFERRYPAFPGLNLTFEVREGLVKHSRDYEPGTHPELAEYRLDERPPLEAQLIDPADEVAYNCADLDDAVEARLLEPAEVRDAIPRFRKAYEEAVAAYPGADPQMQFNDALRRLLDFLVTALIEETARAADVAGARTPDDVRRSPERLARMAPEAAETSRQLKDLLRSGVYRSAALERESLHSAEKIRELFEYYVRMPERMPRIHRDRAAREPVHRVVCDYLAGMTDKYLLRQHAERLG
jgi:dGTPase